MVRPLFQTLRNVKHCRENNSHKKVLHGEDIFSHVVGPAIVPLPGGRGIIACGKDFFKLFLFFKSFFIVACLC